MAEEVSAAHSGVEPICSSHKLEHGNDGIQEELMLQLLVDHVLRKGCTCIPYALTLTLLISNILSLWGACEQLQNEHWHWLSAETWKESMQPVWWNPAAFCKQDCIKVIWCWWRKTTRLSKLLCLKLVLWGANTAKCFTMLQWMMQTLKLVLIKQKVRRVNKKCSVSLSDIFYAEHLVMIPWGHIFVRVWACTSPAFHQNV